MSGLFYWNRQHFLIFLSVGFFIVCFIVLECIIFVILLMFFTPLVEHDILYVIRLFIFIKIKMANFFQFNYSVLSTLANKRVVFNNKGPWSMELFLIMKEQNSWVILNDEDKLWSCFLQWGNAELLSTVRENRATKQCHPPFICSNGSVNCGLCCLAVLTSKGWY